MTYSGSISQMKHKRLFAGNILPFLHQICICQLLYSFPNRTIGTRQRQWDCHPNPLWLYFFPATVEKNLAHFFYMHRFKVSKYSLQALSHQITLVRTLWFWLICKIGANAPLLASNLSAYSTSYGIYDKWRIQIWCLERRMFSLTTHFAPLRNRQFTTSPLTRNMLLGRLATMSRNSHVENKRNVRYFNDVFKFIFSNDIFIIWFKFTTV